MKTIKIPQLKREASLSGEGVDSESRKLKLSFSSEFPVERYFGTEILSHSPGAVDLSRLNNGAQVLFNHDMDEYIGVIERAWIGDDKRGYCEVRFSKNEKAEKVLQDIKDGILKNVSFGYQINEMMLTKAGTNGSQPEYTATKWQPYEVSVVTVPADPTIGIGRSSETIEIEVSIVTSEDESTESESEDETSPTPESEGENEIKNLAADMPAKKGDKTMENIETAKNEAVQAERSRIAGIQALGEKFKQADLARQLIEGGKSLDEARGAFLEKIGATQNPVTGTEGELGLSEREKKEYSFLRAIQAMMNPNDRKFQEAAKYERELSDAAAKKTGMTPKGFLVPVDVLRHKRDLVVGTATAGGNLVATDLLSGSFIELLRNKSALQRAGVTTLNGLVGNIAIPRQTGAATAYWVGEGAAPTESQQAFDQVSLSPKTVGAFTDYSRKLMLQSSVDVESMIRGDLATVLALAIDKAGLYGLGSSNQPAGLNVTAGINVTDFTVAIPTFAEIVDMESKIAADNADIGAMKYIVDASMRGALKTKEKATGYPVYIWEPGGTINGYATEVSNQLTANDIWFGVWSQLMMGFWSGIDIMVDPYTGSKEGNVRVVAHQDVDIAVRHPEAFCKGYVATP